MKTVLAPTKVFLKGCRLGVRNHGRSGSGCEPSPCLARQPILAQDEKVLGSELLFSEGPEDNRFSSDADSATCSMIDTLNVMGLDVVCDGRLAIHQLHPPDVIEGIFLPLAS